LVPPPPTARALIAQATTRSEFTAKDLGALINNGHLFNPPNPAAIKYISDHLDKNEDEQGYITDSTIRDIKQLFLQAVLDPSNNIPSETKNLYRQFLYNPGALRLRAYNGTLSLDTRDKTDIDPLIEISKSGQLTQLVSIDHHYYHGGLDKTLKGGLFNQNVPQRDRKIALMFIANNLTAKYRGKDVISDSQINDVKEQLLEALLLSPRVPEQVKQAYSSYEGRSGELRLRANKTDLILGTSNNNGPEITFSPAYEGILIKPN
jgi:hypothetical protein